MYRKGEHPHGYFYGWNIVDIVNLGLFAAVAIQRMNMIYEISEMVEKGSFTKPEFNADVQNAVEASWGPPPPSTPVHALLPCPFTPPSHPDTHNLYLTPSIHALQFGKSVDTMNSINAVICFIKLFKYLDSHPSLGQFTRTISQAQNDLGSFMLVIVIGESIRLVGGGGTHKCKGRVNGNHPSLS